MKRLRKKGWTLSEKLIGLVLISSIGSIAVIAVHNVGKGTAALLEQQSRSLEAVRISRQHYIEDFFNVFQKQVYTFAQNEMIVEATDAFSVAFESLPEQVGHAVDEESEVYRALEDFYQREYRPRLEETGGPWRGLTTYIPASPSARLLQGMYIADNPHVVGEKHLLDAGSEASDYNTQHAHYHPRIREFLTSFGYYDIFILDLEGNLVYSVFKETDFATNFLTGPYRDSNLARVYRKALGAEDPGTVYLEDFKPYEPSYGAAAAFLGTPVFSDGKMIGVVVFQLPVDRMSAIMGDTSGLGETGETYLIASDRLMRSTSRFNPESSILRQEVSTEAALQALDGQHGTIRQTNYRGVDVLSSFGPVRIPGLNWAILAEMEMAEVTTPAVTMRNEMITYGFGLGGVFIVCFLFLVRRIVLDPINRLAEGTRRIERGDYSTPVVITSSDELGDLARAMNHMAETVAQDLEVSRQALWKSEEKYRKLVESVQVIVWHGDPETFQFTFVSCEAESMLGYPVERWIDEPSFWIEHVHPEDRVWVPSFCAEATRKLQTHEFEYRMIAADGRVVWLRDIVNVIVEDGRAKESVGVMIDITERKQAEEALRESEERFSKAFHGSPSAITLTSIKDNRLIEVNEGFERMFGYTRAEAIGRSSLDLNLWLDPEDRTRLISALRDEGKVREMEVRYRTKSGEEGIAEVTADVIDVGGEPCILAVGHNITARKRAEEVLRRSQEELERLVEERTSELSAANARLELQNAALESAANGIVITDRKGNIEWANPAFSALTGYRIEEVLGRNPRFLKSGKQEPEFYQDLWTTVLAGKVWHGEIINRRKDGSFYTEEQMITPVQNDEGKVMHFIAIKQDVTERKRAEQRLKLHARVLESMAEGVSLADEEGIIVYTNPAMDAMFGYEPEELIGEHVTTLNTYPPEENAREVGEIIEQLKTEGIWQGEFINRKKDGTPFTTEAYISALEIGGKMYWVSVQQDITERRHAEEALRESEEKFYKAFHARTDPTSIVSLENGRILDVNEGYLQAYGYRREAVVGKTASGLSLWGTSDKRNAMMALLHKQGRLRNLEVEMHTSAGEARTVLLSADLIHLGKEPCILFSSRDITERKKDEERLEHSLSLFRSTLESTADGILVVDGQGNIVSFNEKFASMWRIPQDILASRDDDRALGFVLDQVADPEAFLDQVKALYSNPEAESFDTLHFKDERVFERYSRPQRIGDAIVGRVWSFRDITERKRAEEALQHYADDLKRSNQELEQFAYIASHDLQEPLRKIQAFGDRIQDKYLHLLDERPQDYFQRMQSAAARMQTLITDLLALSRVTSKAQPFVAVDLGEVVSEVLSDLEVQIEQTGGRVEVGALPVVEADRVQMRQLFQNLIGNALKFHREGVAPRVRIGGEVSCNGEASLRQCVLSVRDNGIGFERKYVDRIFRPFQRLHGRSRYEGTGIGLAICEKIVQRHGGGITVESEPGEGTTFFIALNKHVNGEIS
ncbi:MAG: PAS domain S-box protein [Rhodothermales bacterium]